MIAPDLASIPVVGRILIAIAAGHGSDTEAVEKLQAEANKLKTQRQTRITRNGRYVLKASDAMKCVETHLMSGGVLLAFGKGLVNILTGKSGAAPDLLFDQIATCIEEHVLRQDTPRVISDKRRYHRPSRGHGKGRGKF